MTWRSLVQRHSPGARRAQRGLQPLRRGCCGFHERRHRAGAQRDLQVL